MESERAVEKTYVTEESKDESTPLGRILGGEPTPEGVIRALTVLGALLAAGAYGFVNGRFTPETVPEYAWVYLLLGLGIGGGFVGLLALMALREEVDDGD